MKKFICLLIGFAFTWTMSSCSDYLNINTDPDNPTVSNASNDVRLPWIQYYYGYAAGTASMRTNTILGLLTQTYAATGANSLLAAWNPSQSSCTTVYQNIYVGAAVNIDPMIQNALTNGEYHYVGAGYALKAMGFMLMLDLHGELPVQEMGILKTNPAYDDGKKMYEFVMGYLDEAIKYFKMEQKVGSMALSKGDIWNGGSIDRWLKLCHGLKARYMLRLSKKAEGTDLYSFNMDGILSEIEQGPQSNDENIIVNHVNKAGDQTNFTVTDPYSSSYLWDCTAYGATQRATRYYADLLTNSFIGGSRVIDPRMSKLLPAMMTNITLDSNGNIKSYVWKRDIGVDMMNDAIRQNGGPLTSVFVVGTESSYSTIDGGLPLVYSISDESTRQAFTNAAGSIHKIKVDGTKVTVYYQKGAAYVNSTNYLRAGDTIYVNMRANHLDTGGRSVTDQCYYPTTSAPYIAGTGTFYARPNSDTYILTYSEMCFIKAEILFRKKKNGEALAAYKDGIKANFDQMQAKLRKWKSAGSVNPDEMPMDDADIATYMSSQAVIQDPAKLTMADIMRQKMIAMGINSENWVDARRFNYSSGNIKDFGVVYTDYKRPKEFTATNKIVGTSPTDLTYWFRRFSQSTHESNYNSSQLMASNKLAMKDPIWSCPVWWDCATDDEYYGYIK
ncbi:SusD/RagB family nutrient-binding outer membrane lipoprotein [Bacteroidaceae bacterium HV4-6-C5C]|nr:SusD/RagB family nutrient-binding outer membrane lipoprotein [Bacteroidaceae bacterium HV4-6-C5C]